MNILVTNDDGILSEGLWTLARELNNIARVIVVAPDREQSATGTAVTLRQPLRVQKIKSLVPEIEAYAVEGTPSDSVILALGKLARDKIDLVISGINHGSNLGEDVHISGTVSAALQGYLQGFPSIAIAAPFGNSQQLDTGAKVAALLTRRVANGYLPASFLLNVNLPDVPPAEIKGVKVTRLADESHVNAVEEGDDGRRKYYWLVRQRSSKVTHNETDIWAIEQGNISVTPLHLKHSSQPLLLKLNELCPDLFQEIQSC